MKSHIAPKGGFVLRILYGIVGEGMGHATRSQVILEHLVKRHEVTLAASGKALEYLGRYFRDILDIEGFNLVYKDNAVDRSASLSAFFRALPKKARKNALRLMELGAS